MPMGRQEFMMREEALTQPAASLTLGSGPGTWHAQSHRSVTVKGRDEQGHISNEPTAASCLGGCAPSCCLATAMLSANDARNRIRWTFAFFPGNQTSLKVISVAWLQGQFWAPGTLKLHPREY